jgi:hypothetical protein
MVGPQMNKTEKLANWLLTGEIEKIDLKESAELLLAQEQEIKNLVKTLDSALEEIIKLRNERI